MDKFRKLFYAGSFSSLYDELSLLDDATLSSDPLFPVMIFWSRVLLQDGRETRLCIKSLKARAIQSPEMYKMIEVYENYHLGAYSDAKTLVKSSFESTENEWVQLFVLCYAYRLCEHHIELRKATEYASEALTLSQKLGLEFFTLRCQLNLAEFYLLQMDLNLSLHYLQKTITTFKQYPYLRQSSLVNTCSGTLLQIHYMTDEKEQFESLLNNWSILESPVLPHLYANIFMVIETLISFSFFERADRAISALKGCAQEKGLKAVYRHLVTYVEPFLFLSRAIKNRDTNAIANLYKMWADFELQQELPASPYLLNFYYIQRFLTAFYMKEYEDAREVLHLHQQRFPLKQNYALFWIRENYFAVLLDASGEKEEAKEKLVSVIRKVLQTGYVRLFIDNYHGNENLLREAISVCQATENPLPQDFLDVLLQNFISKQKDALAQFSEREKEVLELLASDSTQQDIARSLYISKNTVKFHVKNIYKKIGVDNRKEARRLIKRYYA